MEHKNEAFRLISEGFFVECRHSKLFAVKRKTLDRAGRLVARSGVYIGKRLAFQRSNVSISVDEQTCGRGLRVNKSKFPGVNIIRQ
ncbi:hypothetical protein SAMN05216524_104420 [Mucilaginibacter sp. OK098]|nr:hypothetical protein SAMN05216524_104420 [Mucilaginibacter sp. OK098]